MDVDMGSERVVVDLVAERLRSDHVECRLGRQQFRRGHPEDGEPLATSPLGALQDALLFVNSDIYVSGARELADVDTPDALVGLDRYIREACAS